MACFQRLREVLPRPGFHRVLFPQVGGKVPSPAPGKALNGSNVGTAPAVMAQNWRTRPTLARAHRVRRYRKIQGFVVVNY